METIFQCFPVLTTCLPVRQSERSKKKIFLYKIISKLFKAKVNGSTSTSKENDDIDCYQKLDKQDCSYPVYTNMKYCPCKICDLKKSLSFVME